MLKPATKPSSALVTAVTALEAKGLKRVGSFFLLPDDAAFPEGLKAIRRNEVLADRDESARRVLAGGFGADDEIAQLQKEIVALHDEMDKVKGDAARYNRYVGEIRKRDIAIDEARKRKEYAQRHVVEMGMPPDTVTPRLEFIARAEGMIKEYARLAGDGEIARLLEAVNTNSTIRHRLGPSPKLKEKLPRLLKERDAIKVSPIKLTVAGGTAMADVSVNGAAPVQMVVDSGASLIVLSAEVAAKLDVRSRSGDSEEEFRIADGSLKKARVTKLDSVRVGGFLLRNVPCAILPASAKDAHCLLGGSFLGHFVVRTDLSSGLMTLTPRDDAVERQEQADGARPSTRPAAAATRPADGKLASKDAAISKHFLTIDARVDGDDTVTLTRDGITWEHGAWAWPADVHVNGEPWDPHAQSRIPFRGKLKFLAGVDVSSARVISRSGRGEITVESTVDGTARIHFNDGENGAADYSVQLAFDPK